jgi:hypothetical protein
MRNRIPEVTEAAVIEDFYRGSNDSAFIRAILQKAPTTSEQLFREADLYITADERAQDLIGGAKPAPAAPRRDPNQQPDKRWEKRPREEVHAAGPPASRAQGGPRGGERTLDDILDVQCPYHKDMRHTLRNYRDFKHFVGHGRPFQPLPPPPPRGGPEEPRQPQQQEEGGGGAFPRVDREVNVIFGGHGSQESRRQQKLNDRQILVATTGPPAPYRWSEHPITFTRADQWLNFDHPGKYPLLVDPVIRESRVKKVLVDGVSHPGFKEQSRVHLIHAPKKTTYIITECIEINVIKHQSIYYIAEDLLQNKRINIKRTKDRRRKCQLRNAT